MWKASALCLLLLAACDGSGGSSSNSNGPLTIGSAVGKTYVPAGPSMAIQNGYDPVQDRQATIQIVSKTQINVNGIPLMADSNGTTFRSADGTYVMEVASSIEGVDTDQILYMMAEQDLGSNTFVTPYVMGNATPISGIPITSGAAVYTGKMTLVSDSGLATTMDGPVLVVSLLTADVTGSMTFAGELVELEPTKLTGGSFYTTIASTGSDPAVSGTIDGTMYGSEGQEIGGTIGFEYDPTGSDPESYVGYYGTTSSAP